MQDHLETLTQFRQAIYASFPYRRDTLVELLDALSSNERAQSPVELSLHPVFERQYSALYRAIAVAYAESEYPVCSLEAYRQGAIILSSLPQPESKSYRVFGIDEPPNERLYARCLTDRQTIHRASAVPGQMPISVGHTYSILAMLPEPSTLDWPRWAIPVSVERVNSLSSAIEVAQSQIVQMMSYSQAQSVAFNVVTVDSRYPTPAFLYELRTESKVVILARLRSNRVLYRQPFAQVSQTRPHWYGDAFRLQDDTTWPPADQQETISLTLAHGQPQSWQLRCWFNRLMRGTRRYRMHQCPFDVVQIQPLDLVGQPTGSPLWLLVWGQQRHQLSLSEVFLAYRQRFNLEHFFAFAKPFLLLTASQTCSTAHEINWVRLACLAQVQLWLARHLVDSLPPPWQRYLSVHRSTRLTPRRVQRGFSRLISQIGSLAVPSKPRGISPGRSMGTRLAPRAPCPRIKVHPPRKLCPCKESSHTV